MGLRWTCVLLVCLGTAGGLRAQPAESTLARIKKEGVLRWGADPSGGAPFCFNDPGQPGKIVGFEVDVAEELARRLGVKAELVESEWTSLIPGLKSGRIDVALNGLEVNDERAEQVSFSAPYFKYAQQVTVRAEDRGRYHSLPDLKGQKIAVLNGSASVDVLKEMGWTEDLIVEYDDSLKPFAAVKAGRAEAAMGESIIARYYASADPELLNLPTLFGPGAYAIAVRKGDRELLDAVNAALADMKRSGALGEIYQRWDIWSERQQELGVAKGAEQTVLPLARPGGEAASSDVNWKIALALLRGAGYTLFLTCASMPLALIFGLALALMARSRHWWVWLPAEIYVQIIRGTPLLVQIYVIFFALPALGPFLHDQFGLPVEDLFTWPALAVGVLCLSANYAAYEAEIHRAGLEAVPKGQREAALSLGMSEKQAFCWIVLPQSFRIILPPVVNDLVSMIKDSSLVSAMSVGELLYVANSVGKATFRTGEMLLAAAAIYLVLSWIAGSLGKWLENRMKQRGLPQVASSGASH